MAAYSPQLNSQKVFPVTIDWGPSPRIANERANPWPEGLDFVEAALLSCQRVDYNTLYVHWYDNSESGKTQAERNASLTQAVRVMDSVPYGVKLRVIVDVREMSLWFIGTGLREWVNELCSSKGWKQIDKCLVVVSSSAMREILTLFPLESRVEFVTSIEEACGKFDLDADLLL